MSDGHPPEANPGDRPDLPRSAYATMARALRVGVVASLVVLTASLAGYGAIHPGVESGYFLSVYPGSPSLDPAQLVAGWAAGNPGSFLVLGVLALVATPIVRVATGFYFFRRNGERTMTIVSFTVLLLLVAAVIGTAAVPR